MWQPASNSFVPYMTSHTKNITSIICDTNYSLKNTLPEKSYHQHPIPYYSTFSEQIINVMLGKVLAPPFCNYSVLFRTDRWRAKKYWSKKKQCEMLYQKPLLSKFAANAKRGVRRMPVVVKRQGLRVLMCVYVTRGKIAKTKMIIIVMIVVTMRSSSCSTCE